MGAGAGSVQQGERQHDQLIAKDRPEISAEKLIQSRTWPSDLPPVTDWSRAPGEKDKAPGAADNGTMHEAGAWSG